MSRGGYRKNSGRRLGSGKFNAPTKPIRVPEHLITAIYQFIEGSGYLLPLYGSKVKAGFPSPADDYLEEKLDLNQYLIKHPAATFSIRASGNSMIGAGICDNALLIVDRSIKPCHGKIVVAIVEGEFTVKRFEKTAKECLLIAANPDYPPITLKESEDSYIWGVVTHVINSM